MDLRPFFSLPAMLPLLFAACTADSFTGSDGGPNDGGSSDSSSTDSSQDVTVDDSGSADGVAPEGGVDLSCANLLAGTVLCDDFDTANSTGPAQKWTTSLALSGQNSFDTVIYHSAPRSYLAQTLAPDGGGGGGVAYASLLKQSTSSIPNNATLTVRAVVRVHAVDPNTPVGLLKVAYTPGSSGTSVWASIVADNDALNLVVQGDGSSITSSNKLVDITLDQWVLCQIDMAPTKVTASLNGQTVQAVNVNLPAPSSSPLPQADLGILSGSTDFATVVNFDNFLFRIH